MDLRLSSYAIPAMDSRKDGSRRAGDSRTEDGHQIKLPVATCAEDMADNTKIARSNSTVDGIPDSLGQRAADASVEVAHVDQHGTVTYSAKSCANTTYSNRETQVCRDAACPTCVRRFPVLKMDVTTVAHLRLSTGEVIAFSRPRTVDCPLRYTHCKVESCRICGR